MVSVGNFTLPLSSVKAILDTGTSQVIVPTFDYNGLMDIFSQNLTCGYEPYSDKDYCECNVREWKDIFVPINITLSQTNTYQLPRDEYIIRE